MKLKCEGCSRILKDDELEYKIGDIVVIEIRNLSNMGIVKPFCKKCITYFEEEGWKS